MAQARVTRFYNTRKRVKDDVKEVNVFEKTQINVNEQISRKTLLSTQVENSVDDLKTNENVGQVQQPENIPESKQNSAPRKTTSRTKVSKTTKNTKKSKSHQTTVTKFYQSVNSSNIDGCVEQPAKDLNILTDEQKGKCFSIPKEIILGNNEQLEKIEQVSSYDLVSEVTSNHNVKATSFDSSQGVKVASNVEIAESNITRSPKRTLPIPVEVTPSKKKPQMCADNLTASQVSMHRKTKDASVCRKLDMNTRNDLSVGDQKINENVGLVQPSANIPELKQNSVRKKATARTKVSKATKSTKESKSNQTTVKKFYQSVNSNIDDSKACPTKDLNLLTDEQKRKTSSIPKEIFQDNIHQEQIELVASSDQVSEVTSNNFVNVNNFDPFVEVKITSKVKIINSSITHSPKRTLPIPVEVTPSKKKSHIRAADATSSVAVVSLKTKDVSVCRKLDMNFPQSPSKASSSFHSPVKSQVSSPRKILSPKEKLNAMIDQSRSKLLLSPKLDELRKSLENFSKKISKHSISKPCKVTSVISPSKSKSHSQVPLSVPAHERFSHLTADDPSSLILPFKFRLLADMFRSMDTVISILHNRKEKITFDKVQDGIQKMMKRNFSKTHLGQIAAVLPSAYSFAIEKCNFMNKKADSKDYQLIITPVLNDEVKKDKKSKSAAFETMHPQCLIDRRSEFNEALLKITKKHHQDFLSKINFPLIPEERLKRWHPKFPVDSVSDILPAQLPEPQESKIYTAKDVLNKVKGTFRNKVEKALQSVADESKKDVTLEFKDISNPKPETSKAALKGICTDLLEKIRARESAKLLETMTRTPDETKRLAMLERLPKIIHILWHYFIAERKASVPIDVAVEKIIHSFNSLTTPDDVKDHLKLITETFPGWLSFIEITKGVYIQIDKKRNINEMLDNFKY